MFLYVTHAARALQSHELSGEGIKLWITYLLFWPHKDMQGLPEWVISPMPGTSPRQHKHERRYTPGTHSVIPTRRIWNDDYGPSSWHLSYRWGKTPKKTSPRKPVPTGDRTRARCVTGAHATACSTAVVMYIYIIIHVCVFLCVCVCVCVCVWYYYYYRWYYLEKSRTRHKLIL